MAGKQGLQRQDTGGRSARTHTGPRQKNPSSRKEVPAGTTDDESLLPLIQHEHYSQRSNWLRAAVLGANDGLISTASIMVGVSAAEANPRYMLLTGIASLVSGALSMAAGEYVSVSSQRDAEAADIERERESHNRGPLYEQAELEELTQIYVDQGVPRDLARQVAEALSVNKEAAVRTHARVEIGIDMDDLTNPWQAASASALAFSVGALIAILSAAFIRDYYVRLTSLVIASTVALAINGATGAYLGGANPFRPAARVILGGWLAMIVSFIVLRFTNGAV